MSDTQFGSTPIDFSLPILALAVRGKHIWAGGEGGMAQYDIAGGGWSVQPLPLTSVTALSAAGNILLAGGPDGLARSEDGGSTWQLVDASGGGSIHLIAAAPDFEQSGVVLAGTLGAGVLRSEDGGRTWKPSSQGMPDGQETEIWTLDWETAEIVQAQAEDALYRSTNRGRAWQRGARESAPVAVASEDITASATDTAAGLTVMAVANGPLYVMRGAQREEIPLPPLNDLRSLIAGEDALYIAGPHAGLVRWQGSGWQRLPNVPAPLAAVAALPGGVLVAAGGNVVARSGDGGQTWTEVRPNVQIGQMSFQPDGKGWAGSTEGTLLLRTLDGGQTWEELLSPFGAMPLAALLALPGAVIAATYDPQKQIARVWRSTDEGQNWTMGVEARTTVPTVPTSSQPPALGLGAQLIIGTPEGEWQPRRVAEAEATGTTEGIRRLAGEGNTLLALTAAGGLRSDDLGATWTPLPDVPAEALDIAVYRGRMIWLLPGGRVMASAL